MDAAMSVDTNVQLLERLELGKVRWEVLEQVVIKVDGFGREREHRCRLLYSRAQVDVGEVHFRHLSLLNYEVERDDTTFDVVVLVETAAGDCDFGRRRRQHERVDLAQLAVALENVLGEVGALGVCYCVCFVLRCLEWHEEDKVLIDLVIKVHVVGLVRTGC